MCPTQRGLSAIDASLLYMLTPNAKISSFGFHANVCQLRGKQPTLQHLGARFKCRQFSEKPKNSV